MTSRRRDDDACQGCRRRRGDERMGTAQRPGRRRRNREGRHWYRRPGQAGDQIAPARPPSPYGKSDRKQQDSGGTGGDGGSEAVSDAADVTGQQKNHARGHCGQCDRGASRGLRGHRWKQPTADPRQARRQRLVVRLERVALLCRGE